MGQGNSLGFYLWLTYLFHIYFPMLGSLFIYGLFIYFNSIKVMWTYFHVLIRLIKKQWALLHAWNGSENWLSLFKAIKDIAWHGIGQCNQRLIFCIVCWEALGLVLIPERPRWTIVACNNSWRWTESSGSSWENRENVTCVWVCTLLENVVCTTRGRPQGSRTKFNILTFLLKM